MATRVFVLLGGFFGPDGPATSPGFIALSSKLNGIENVHSNWYTWSNYMAVIDEIKRLPAGIDIALVGYSGGGTRAIWVSRAVFPKRIGLMVLADPSPRWQMALVRSNVVRVVSFQNQSPFFFGLGGGEVEATKGVDLVIRNIRMQHAFVQGSPMIHNAVLQEVRNLELR